MPLQLSPTQIAFNARGDGTFHRPFAEQVEFLRAKLDLPTEHWDDILKEGQDRGFVVAGALKADILADFHAAVLKTAAEGKSLQWFKKEFENIVARNGWQGWTGEDTPQGRDWRARVIYRTNLTTSHAAGRYAQLTDPELLKVRPFWKYVHNDTVTHPRELHQQWGRKPVVLRHDDPWWQTHYPPNGWGCRCRVTAVRAAEYPGDPAPEDGTWTKTDRYGVTHTLPKGVEYGWDYAPGASRAEELRQLVADKAAKLPGPIGQAFKKDMQVVSKPHIPVANALELPKSGKVKEVAQTVLDVIDKVHSDGNLPRIPIKYAKGNFNGAYLRGISGDAHSIAVNVRDSVNPELTVAHEIGHFIDHQGFGKPNEFASDLDATFKEWREAVKNSQATKTLESIFTTGDPRERQSARYYLTPWEQWARSYAQWLATRGGNQTMKDQVVKITQHSDRPYKASQWDDADFAPIASAIDKLFQSKGWLK